MKKSIDIKKIIKNNPLVKEKTFEKEQALIVSRRKLTKPTEYDILPPFTTERRIRTSVENEDEDITCVNY